MIISGWRSSHIKSEQNSMVSCPHCNEKGGIVSSVYARYVHVFWIPFIPIGKSGGAQCMQCNTTFKPKEMNEELKRAYKRTKSESKRPIWHFLGLIIILLLTLFVLFAGQADSKKELNYINTPLQGDVYKYKTELRHYSTLKVVEVQADSLYISYNNYEVSKRSRVYEINVDSCYASDVYVVSKK